jgi:hypothetical protein
MWSHAPGGGRCVRIGGGHANPPATVTLSAPNWAIVGRRCRPRGVGESPPLDPTEEFMRYPGIILAALTAMLAVPACTDDQKPDTVPTIAAPADPGAPSSTSDSVGSGSSSNAASGSTIRSQEGTTLGRPGWTGY